MISFRDLYLRARALVAPRRVERELDDELAFHLEMETRKHLAAGLPLDEAQTRARAQFGSRLLAAEQCREARGITLVETFAQDIAYALRGVRRAPGVAALIVGTVALGMGLLATVFTIFSAFVLRVEPVREPDELVGVRWADSPNASGRLTFTLQTYDALRRETDVFTDVSARRLDITMRVDGRMMEANLVTGNFFEVLGVTAALGRTLTPADDVRGSGQAVIVISHECWQRVFASDANVLGRQVRINGSEFEIVGVLPEGFRGLDLLPVDYFAPLSMLSQFRREAPTPNPNNLEVIGRLKPGVSRDAARAALVVWASRPTAELPQNQQARNITLEAKGTATPLSPAILLAYLPLFVAFGSILMIGCANVANLLLARSVSRQREIGIRLALGASRPRILRQLLTENLLLALAAAALGLLLSRVVLDTTISVLMRTMPPELAEFLRFSAPAFDWRVVFFLVVAAIAATASFGLIPALQAIRLDLVRTMRGELTPGRPPGRARNTLIVMQVTASALLLICAGIFLRSTLRAASADPGVRTSDTMIVDINNEPFRAALIAAVTEAPSVAAMAASWPEPLNAAREAFGSSDGIGRTTMSYRLVSHDYFNVLDIGVVRGRGFTEAESRSSAAVAIVSETIARRMWPGGDALGQVLRLESVARPGPRPPDEPPLPSQPFIVVGVAQDVAGFRLAGPEAGVYVPTSPDRAQNDLIVRVNGTPERARLALLETLTAIDPNIAMLMTLQTLSRLETYPLQVAFWLTVILGGLALFLTVSGIVGVLSYLVEQRTKEIGVRIILGATTRGVTGLVLSQSLRLVGVGLIAGGGLAWALSALLMRSPLGARVGGFVDLFDPVAYSGSLLCIVVTCALAASLPALRAARIDPASALRHD